MNSGLRGLGCILRSCTSLSIQIHRRTEFSYYHFTLFNKCLLYELQAVTASTPNLPSNHISDEFVQCYSVYFFNGTHSVHATLQNLNLIDLYTESQVGFADNWSISFSCGFGFEVEVELGWVPAFHCTPWLSPTPKLCRYQSRPSLALASCVFRLEDQNYAIFGFRPDAETMVLRTKLSVYFNLTAEAMPFSSQLKVNRNDAGTETMQVRIQPPVYFAFNTETMPVSSQANLCRFESRARASTLDGTYKFMSLIFRLKFQAAGLFNPSGPDSTRARFELNWNSKGFNSTQPAPWGFQLQFNTDEFLSFLSFHSHLIQLDSSWYAVDYLLTIHPQATPPTLSRRAPNFRRTPSSSSRRERAHQFRAVPAFPSFFSSTNRRRLDLWRHFSARFRVDRRTARRNDDVGVEGDQKHEAAHNPELVGAERPNDVVGVDNDEEGGGGAARGSAYLGCRGRRRRRRARGGGVKSGVGSENEGVRGRNGGERRMRRDEYVGIGGYRDSGRVEQRRGRLEIGVGRRLEGELAGVGIANGGVGEAGTRWVRGRRVLVEVGRSRRRLREASDVNDGGVREAGTRWDG
ncbi:hypothetical protein R3P38DRAFT_2789144 [Favolaschia claudopus]|uniref:Uncharacterized protein n=1 Tax=Favolaschia claudopus TaxID=2862362 RepID=A0AAW0AKU0_9AGAR